MVEERLRDRRYDIPLDYKFHVFHGRVQFIQVVHERMTGARFRFYTQEWTPLNIRHGEGSLGPVSEPPEKLDHMIEVAEILAEEFDYVRVDLYNLDDERICFGELTFSPAAGRKPFIPRTFDFELGSYW